MKRWNGVELTNFSSLHYIKGFHDGFSLGNLTCKQQTLFSREEKPQKYQTGEPYAKYTAQEYLALAKERLQPIAVEKEALGYLEKHEYLLELARVARNKLDEYFNPATTEYFLCRIYDPETREEGLMLEIHAAQDFEKAMANLEKFENEWWLDNMPTNGDKLIIDVMFA